VGSHETIRFYQIRAILTQALSQVKGFLPCEFVLCRCRGCRHKTIQTNGVDGSVLIVAVEETALGRKVYFGHSHPQTSVDPGKVPRQGRAFHAGEKSNLGASDAKLYHPGESPTLTTPP
jgi:hypothetical protein